MLKFTQREIRLLLSSFGEVIYYFSFAFLLPLLVSIYYGEGPAAIISYLVPFLVALALGYSLKTYFKIDHAASEATAFTLILLIWTLAPLIAATPYITYLDVPAIDAYFESISAFTTTGLTMITAYQPIPNSLLFWRSLEAWIGGAGLIVLALVGLLRYTRASQLYEAEGRTERLRPNVVNTVKLIWKIYISLTFAGTALLILTKVDPFRALNYAMSAISTTGLVDTASNLVPFGVETQFALALISITGATSFLIAYQFVKGNLKAPLQSLELKMLITMAIISAALIAPKIAHLYGEESLRIATFHSIAAITNGGFATTLIDTWGDFPKLLLSMLMIFGGSAGSTAGGLKLIRVWIYIKSLWWRIKRYSYPPNVIIPRKIRGVPVKDEDIYAVTRFIILYLLFIMLGITVLAFTLENVNAGNIIIEVTSAQGNVGLTSGITHAGMPIAAKAMLMLNMIVGRIEIYPLMALVGFIIKMRRS
ncbi:MAG: TrkH family potassium uptake protein [DPANN group archaeon]|nr:TrkH family potassium uptake protein [DPANN group archaeon]